MTNVAADWLGRLDRYLMISIKQRFEGPENKQRLIEVLLRQTLVLGDRSLATEFINHGKLAEQTAGDILMSQGGLDDDLCFVIVGSFDLIINGQMQAIRSAGTHVGEMVGADPTRTRSATLRARETSLVLRVPQEALARIASADPSIWHRVSLTLMERLRERDRSIGHANDMPRVFVISSSEGRHVAEEVMRNLDGPEIAVQLWDRGTFGASDYAVTSVMDAIYSCDFTITIVPFDDTLISRGLHSRVARDNVNLEYGISLGLLGRLRSVLLVDADTGIMLPSDLAGLTTLRFRSGSDDAMKRSIRVASVDLREHIAKAGVFRHRTLS